MPRVDSKKFFQEQSTHSRVKAEVVFKYVTAWLQIVLSAQAKSPSAPQYGAYVDLFSGPGSYEDGNRSTPLLILEKVVASQRLRGSFKTFFNDENEALTTSLHQEIDLIPDIQLLGHEPVYSSKAASISLFESLGLSTRVPVFVFLDQFGYSDVTPVLIQRIFRHEKADCAFFFRTSRVIGAVTNRKVVTTLDRVFGTGVLENLRRAFDEHPVSKEEIVLAELKEVMKRSGAKYFHAFPFRIHESGSSRHHLIYLGKHERGLALMKEIMGKASSRHSDGVPVMGYSDVSATPSLFEFDLIPSLQRDLLTSFSGRELSVSQIFSAHHPRSTQFVLRNYQEALRRLEEDGKVDASPSADKRPRRNGKVTMGDVVKIRFPQGVSK